MAAVTPDILTDVASIKKLLRIQGSAQDDNLGALVSAASVAIARWCKRAKFLASDPITEFPRCRNSRKLVLSETPVQCPILTGTTTLGSAIVTGLASTTHLFADQGVVSPNVPLQSFVGSVDSAIQVTLNQAATASGSVALTFGVALWLDDTGYYGTAPDAFPASTQLFEGSDFAIVRDGDNGNASATGFIERIGSVWRGRWISERNLLSAALVESQGFVKVKYVAGLDAIPADVQLAATKLAAAFWRDGSDEGWPPAAESLTRQMVDRAAAWPELTGLHGLLMSYRRLK